MWNFQIFFGFYFLTVYVCGIMGNKKTQDDKYESVKISREVVNLVRENKKKNRIPISAFFETAALKELKTIKK